MAEPCDAALLSDLAALKLEQARCNITERLPSSVLADHRGISSPLHSVALAALPDPVQRRETPMALRSCSERRLSSGSRMARTRRPERRRRRRQMPRSKTTAGKVRRCCTWCMFTVHTGTL